MDPEVPITEKLIVLHGGVVTEITSPTLGAINLHGIIRDDQVSPKLLTNSLPLPNWSL